MSDGLQITGGGVSALVMDELRAKLDDALARIAVLEASA